MRNSHVDKRATRYAARQFVSDYETEVNGAAMKEEIVTSPVERSAGVVKFFNGEKGFGFVRRDGGAPDVFIHANALKRSGIENGVQTGDRLEFDVLPVEGKGPKASNIKYLGKGT